MAIEKLSEFAKDGQKNTDDLNLTDGFPVSKKPARQWFNWLFNTLTSKVNEIIDADFIPKADIVNNLTTDDAKKPVSAKQAKNLQDNKLDKTANAVSATKLKDSRKINTIDFDGSQDINIEAPLRFAGNITTLEQLNAAVLDGKYAVQELNVAGLYGYGFLVVLRTGGVCHQIYYPHAGSHINNATMAMRQTWNVNGDIASWSEWRVVGTRDDSKLPLAGGTVTGDLRVAGISYLNRIRGDNDLWVTSEDELNPRRILSGGLLVSEHYNEANRIPALGIYSRGDIATSGLINVDAAEAQFRHESSGRYLSLNGSGWGVYSAQGAVPLSTLGGGTGNIEGRAPSADRLATPRNVFGQTFDGTGDVGGTITATTGLVRSSENHFIDMGRGGSDRMNFYNYGATFNFIDSQNGNVVARITQNGIDCNAASASKLKTPRNIALAGAVSGNVDFDGSGNITINTQLKENTAVVRAFCSFNGTGAPVILAESNIASISVSSLKFTVTFKTPMPHADYVINGFASDVTNSNRVAVITMNPDMIPSKTVNGFDFYARYSSNASTNIASPLICFSIVC